MDDILIFSFNLIIYFLWLSEIKVLPVRKILLVMTAQRNIKKPLHRKLTKNTHFAIVYGN